MFKYIRADNAIERPVVERKDEGLHISLDHTREARPGNGGRPRLALDPDDPLRPTAEQGSAQGALAAPDVEDRGRVRRHQGQYLRPFLAVVIRQTRGHILGRISVAGRVRPRTPSRGSWRGLLDHGQDFAGPVPIRVPCEHFRPSRRRDPFPFFRVVEIAASQVDQLLSFR